jgi:hypothetical protein
LRFRVTFQFRGTASGFPIQEYIYADSEAAARELAEKVAAKHGYRVLGVERAE